MYSTLTTENASGVAEQAMDKPISAPSPYASSPHSNKHNSIPQLFSDDPKDDIVINTSNHYTYLVIVASTANYTARRSLIREKYFGLADNLLPCMHYDTDTLHKFWIYGDLPTSHTSTYRQYEAEKMEWNDIVEAPTGVTFEQSHILYWVETNLRHSGITYDYLILQDIHTFVRLSDLKRELDSGVIGENTDSPFTINQNEPLNLVWSTFTGDRRDKYISIVGSKAVHIALEKQTDIDRVNGSCPHLLTNMYHYYRSVAPFIIQKVDAQLDAEAAAEEQERMIPDFIDEDETEKEHRIRRWTNNIESIRDHHLVVTHVFQDNEFLDLTYRFKLKPLIVCNQRTSAFRHGPLIVESIDDDQDIHSAYERDHDLHVTHWQATGESIAIATPSFMQDECGNESMTLWAENKRNYALRHGYAFVARSAEFDQHRQLKNRAIGYAKLDVVEKLLPKYDWVVWMDVNTVIMHQDQSIEQLIHKLSRQYPDGPQRFHETIDFILTRPHEGNASNSGIFLIRNAKWTMEFLRKLQEMTELHDGASPYIQDAVYHLINRVGDQRRILILDSNNHALQTSPEKYVPKDFVVHYDSMLCPSTAAKKGLAAAKAIAQGEFVIALSETPN
ncbi:uncharacterized protein BYT42DRAFT_613856 [Radiomyces spectabilis]|uniref:uncharacterized protein n=1 Tax=Radiomyces spectabilis TaxID=64574 RepID=UPI00221F4FF4|nr:uncharacterized protein BYT42DRAFT_613856 [Radiomyces spectabilis]KAI8379560.1 hypothetical protein BYT42DRAFT_613856 [Radiomyces spectabilis]